MKHLHLLKKVLLIFFVLYSINSKSQGVSKTIFGKIYYQSGSSQYPATYKSVVLMPNTKQNITLAQDLYNLFNDETIKNISGARVGLTSKSGDYQFNNVGRGNYIIRVTGMGGMVIKFTIASDNSSSVKIPDMPADYYYHKLDVKKYVRIN